MYLTLKRMQDNGVQTTGSLVLSDSNGNKILGFDTLELSYRDNKREKSCINTGTYVIKKHFSLRFGHCFKLYNVFGRDNILIHYGNFNKDTKGCILIGNGFRDINLDGEKDLCNSRLAMKNLLRTLKSTTTIKINSYF